MEKLSVVIITLNEEQNIERCLHSIKNIADEIILLDSFSTDKTIEIAKQLNAKIYQEPFRGYVEQKNRATNLATHNYVLNLDADEELDPTLQEAIKEEKNQFTYSAYKMNRCTNYYGRFIRNGSVYPDRKVRLYDKRIAEWTGFNLHEKIKLNKSDLVKLLNGEILHYPFPTIESHILQNKTYSDIAAKSYFEAKVRTNKFKIFFNPIWAFVNCFIVRKGFLDGRIGFDIAKRRTQYTYLKHKKLFALQKGYSIKDN